MTLAKVRCEQCGQLDDHPMVHISGGRSVHHDCLSFDEREMVYGSSPLAARAIELAESGVHGDDLRAAIAQLHAEQPQELPSPVVPEEAPAEGAATDPEEG